jgi:hypothetical protein
VASIVDLIVCQSRLVKALFINRDRYHAEVFVGMENIFKVFRVDYLAGWQHQQRLLGIRISMPLTITGGREE